uniref:Cadherin domain-containing protein n=1 Tax=Zosterops lateralis melanops TaxID=1220523 RepID=A0A8D2PQA3_ZOSLA
CFVVRATIKGWKAQLAISQTIPGCKSGAGNSLWPVLIISLDVSATDPDQAADQNAISYSLHGQGASSEFSINENTGEISAHKRLDREKRSTWRFLVLATDEGGEGLTGFADVIIEVRDVNDNSPLFLCVSDGCFTGHIPEDSPADTPIMEMTAVDLDDPKAGINAVLTYSIIQNVKNEINLNLFSIDSVSGTISTVLGALDREKEDKYLVVVEARDGGGLTGTGTATILVTDVNDHAPVFLQRIYTAFVSENASINTEVVVVSAVDRDEGENAMVTFSIIDGDNDRKFSIETDEINNCGFIRLRKRIDFEKPHERVFNLTVKAEDMDFFSITHCVIYVEDSNDHAPIFYPQFYEVAALAEDVPVGTKVIQVSAVDLDSGLNGRFSFHLQNKSDPGGQFSLASDGWLMVAGLLDHETVAQYKLIVIGTDMGQPPLTGSATVLVTLQDVNDNGPEFEAHYNPVVWENTASPQVVQMNETSTLLFAKDRDTAANGAPFSFRLLSDSDGLTSFSLQDFHNGSAMLTALHTFDREVHKAFYLPILITDSGIPPMSSTNTLTVNIGDQNDHPHSAGYMECLIYSYDGKSLPDVSLLVSYTVWSQWGSSGFRKGGIYHIPEERESWEDVRENVFNYNEEGGGEPAAPHSRTPTGPKRDSLPKHAHQKQSISAVTSIPDFKEYVSQIIRDADNDLKGLPADTIHFYCLEGQCSLAGSLSSLDSISGDEDVNYDFLQEWGSKFEKLKELYLEGHPGKSWN